MEDRFMQQTEEGLNTCVKLPTAITSRFWYVQPRLVSGSVPKMGRTPDTYPLNFPFTSQGHASSARDAGNPLTSTGSVTSAEKV